MGRRTGTGQEAVISFPWRLGEAFEAGQYLRIFFPYSIPLLIKTRVLRDSRGVGEVGEVRVRLRGLR